jgi:ankyrin repeat protein
MVLHLAACSSVSIEVMEYLLEENFVAMNQQDSLGNLPVHCAVKHFAPYEVISLLMSHHRTHCGFTTVVNNSLQTLVHIACSSNPSIIDKIEGCFYDKEPLKMRDINGNLPLHIACSNFHVSKDRPCSNVVWQLIRGYHEALQIPNKDGNLSLHMACETNQRHGTILQQLNTKYCGWAFPDAAKVKNKDGKLPLHLACEKDANIFTIESLLSCYPLAALVRDNNGNLPLHLYCHRNQKRLCLEKLEKLMVSNSHSLFIRNKDRKCASCYLKVT